MRRRRGNIAGMNRGIDRDARHGTVWLRRHLPHSLPASPDRRPALVVLHSLRRQQRSGQGMLREAEVQDTAYVPAGDTFELGACAGSETRSVFPRGWQLMIKHSWNGSFAAYHRGSGEELKL